MFDRPVEIIVAATRNGEIGYRNTLPWRLKGDLKRFKELTMGQIVVMGKNTYASLPGPLKGRTVIVVGSAPQAVESGSSVLFAVNLGQCNALINDRPTEQRVFIAGGAKLYELALSSSAVLHLTTVYKESETGYDTRISNFNLSGYSLIGEPEVMYEINPRTKVVEVSHTYAMYLSNSNEIPLI